MLEKIAAISNQRARINEIIVASLNHYAEMNNALDQLVQQPGEDAANDVDTVFAEMNDDLLKIRNAVTTLANLIVSDDGDVEEVDVAQDENGIRLL